MITTDARKSCLPLIRLNVDEKERDEKAVLDMQEQKRQKEMAEAAASSERDAWERQVQEKQAKV